jgi:hypothetical protein
MHIKIQRLTFPHFRPVFHFSKQRYKSLSYAVLNDVLLPRWQIWPNSLHFELNNANLFLYTLRCLLFACFVYITCNIVNKLALMHF